MPKRDLKSGTKQRAGKKQREFVEPVVLTPVQVLPDVARDVATLTRELVKRLSVNSGSTQMGPALRARVAAGSKAR